jgi:hypothetical protein
MQTPPHLGSSFRGNDDQSVLDDTIFWAVSTVTWMVGAMQVARSLPALRTTASTAPA